MKKKKGAQAAENWIAQFRSGDWVCDLDKEPDPVTNKGTVETVLLHDQLVRVRWKDGTISDHHPYKLGKMTVTSSYAPDPAERKKMWDEILKMSDEEIDAEIELHQRRLNLN